MSTPQIMAAAALGAITVLELLALSRGINGKALSLAIGAIAALGGVLTGHAIP